MQMQINQLIYRLQELIHFGNFYHIHIIFRAQLKKLPKHQKFGCELEATLALDKIWLMHLVLKFWFGWRAEYFLCIFSNVLIYCIIFSGRITAYVLELSHIITIYYVCNVIILV